MRVALIGAVLIAVAAIVLVRLVDDDPQFEARISIAGSNILLKRTSRGGSVMQVVADDVLAGLRGQGWVHAMDRGVQMFFVRLIAYGRLSEFLTSNAKTNHVDKTLRALNIEARATEAERLLDEETRAQLVAYAEGVNAYMASHGRPLEFLMTGYVPEPWTPRDSLATINIMGIADLAEEQLLHELWLVQALRAGVSPSAIRAFYSSELVADLKDDSELVSLLRRVHIAAPLLPVDLPYLSSPLRGLGSNNWAVSGAHTVSGKPMMAADPHLEISRLPAIWYEHDLRIGVGADAHEELGIAMPGVPATAMGRTRTLAYSFTYGFGDQYSLFIEQIQNGSYRVDGEDGTTRWVPLTLRRELIKRKGDEPMLVTYAHTRNGLVRCDNDAADLADGLHLAGSFSISARGLAASAAALARFSRSRTVVQAADVLQHVALSLNFIVVDTAGGMALQQTGEFAMRGTGFNADILPHRGWREAERNQADKTVPVSDLVRVLNPASGVLTTANNDVCAELYRGAEHARRCVISLHMGPDRTDQVRAQLQLRTAGGAKLTAVDFIAMHGHTLSPPAYRLLGHQAGGVRAVLEDVLAREPNHAGARLLLEWDSRIGVDSKAASLYEELFQALLLEMFGTRLLGEAVWQASAHTTPLLDVYSYMFERVLHAEQDLLGLYGGSAQAKRDALGNVTRTVLSKYAVSNAGLAPWGAANAFMLKNVFFDGQLPGFLGFDYGPVPQRGHRNVLRAEGAFMSDGRHMVWSQSWTCVADLADGFISTTLPGGPSGRRMSSLYTSEIPFWWENLPKRVYMSGHEPSAK